MGHTHKDVVPYKHMDSYTASLIHRFEIKGIGACSNQIWVDHTVSPPSNIAGMGSIPPWLVTRSLYFGPSTKSSNRYLIGIGGGRYAISDTCATIQSSSTPNRSSNIFNPIACLNPGVGYSTWTKSNPQLLCSWI